MGCRRRPVPPIGRLRPRRTRCGRPGPRWRPRSATPSPTSAQAVRPPWEPFGFATGPEPHPSAIRREEGTFPALRARNERRVGLLEASYGTGRADWRVPPEHERPAVRRQRERRPDRTLPDCLLSLPRGDPEDKPRHRRRHARRARCAQPDGSRPDQGTRRYTPR